MAVGDRRPVQSKTRLGDSPASLVPARADQLAVRERRTSVATEATSSPGSTGLARCISKPARSALVRSSDRAKAVSAAAGRSRTRGCRRRADARDQLEAIHLRHAEVGDQHVWA